MKAEEKVPFGECCRIQSIVQVDDRGQMVLPKDIREKAGIKAGDKLALIGWEKGDSLCCISLVKADQLDGMVRGFLSPMLASTGETEKTEGEVKS